MELTKEAKDLIQKEVDEKIKEFKSTISIINTYKWIGGILLTLLGVSGFWGLNEFIDKKVAERIQLYDNYYFALASINTKNFKDAYITLTRSWKEIKEKKYYLTISNEFEKSYYQNILYLLSELDESQVNYDLQEGSYTWNELKKDEHFLQYKEQFNNNDYYGLVNYSACEVKYEKPEYSVLENAIILVKRAIEMRGIEGMEDKVGWYFYLIQLNLLKNDSQSALEYVKLLKNTSFSDYDTYKRESKSFENTIYGKYWANLFKRYNPNIKVETFYNNYKKIICF